MYLSNILDDRLANNSNYSLRSFAKSLNIDASHLSKILSRKQILSMRLTELIIQSLNVTGKERILFIESVAEEQKCKSIENLDSSLTDCADVKK